MNPFVSNGSVCHPTHCIECDGSGWLDLRACEHTQPCACFVVRDACPYCVGGIVNVWGCECSDCEDLTRAQEEEKLHAKP